MLREYGTKRHPARQIFEPNYDLRCRAFDKLRKYVEKRKKKRKLNMIATRFIIFKYKGIALTHWTLLYQFQVHKREKMAAVLNSLYLQKKKSAFDKINDMFGVKVSKRKLLRN